MVMMVGFQKLIELKKIMRKNFLKMSIEQQEVVVQVEKVVILFLMKIILEMVVMVYQLKK